MNEYLHWHYVPKESTSASAYIIVCRSYIFHYWLFFDDDDDDEAVVSITFTADNSHIPMAISVAPKHQVGGTTSPKNIIPYIAFDRILNIYIRQD